MRLTLRSRGKRGVAAPARRSITGQSLVELALILPLMITMASGVFEFSRLIYATVCVSHAARDGARLAMDSTVSDSSVISRAIASGAPFTISSGNVVVSSRSAGSQLSVKVTYRFTFLLPGMSTFFPGGYYDIVRTRYARVQD